MRLLPHLTKLTAPAQRHLHASGRGRPHTAEHACPRVHLSLSDGAGRDYLLDDPGACPRPGTARAVYDPRVHLAYILARQGHDAHWLARFADLPLPAAHRIVAAAALAHA
ncbi:hypothetical protein ABZ769_22860 [Streptomyces olivoreticuli]